MIDTTKLLTIKEASQWASNYTGKDITPSNISYLIQYGRIKKLNDNGYTRISIIDLQNYYNLREVTVKEDMPVKTDIRLGDCKDILTEIPDNFIDLIVTSPPYAAILLQILFLYNNLILWLK